MSRLWVIDTSSIIAVRRVFAITGQKKDSRTLKKLVFAAMKDLAKQERLVYPSQVHRELKDENDKSKTPHDDLPFDFVEDTKKIAMKTASFDYVKQLMSDTGTRRMIDYEAEDKEEADPYVVAVALELRDQGIDVGVVTQERSDSLGRISMNTVCGLKDLVCVPLRAFLHRENIWPMERATELDLSEWKALGPPKKLL
jgi:hypothetical protein